MERPPTRILVLLVVLMNFAPIQACAYSGGPLEGTVLEEGTNQRIPDAIVVVLWRGTAFGFGHTQTVCLHGESATTDGQGRYYISRWRKSIEPAGVRGLEKVIVSHKPGHQWSSASSTKNEVQYLRRFVGTREERLAYLKQVEYATRCPNAKELEKNFLVFYRTLHEEAKSLVVTMDEQRIADGFLTKIEMIELGYETAMKRAIDRAERRKRQQ